MEILGGSIKTSPLWVNLSQNLKSSKVALKDSRRSFPHLETGDGNIVCGPAAAERGKSAFYFEILSVT